MKNEFDRARGQAYPFDMPKVRPNTQAKWMRRTSSATVEFEEGVKNPRADWKASTMAAANNHTQAVQQAVAEKRFEKGVAASSSDRWARKTLSKGAARFAGGVQDAADDYGAGVAPYLEVIEKTQLPARGPKGDPKNFERVKVMANALRAKKLGR